MTDKLTQKMDELRPILAEYRKMIDEIEVSPQSIQRLTEIAAAFSREIGTQGIPMFGAVSDDGEYRVFNNPASEYAQLGFDLARKYLGSYAMAGMCAGRTKYLEILDEQGIDTSKYSGPLCMLVMASDELEDKFKLKSKKGED